MKRIISVVLCLALLAGALSVVAGARKFIHDETFVLGDVNGDGFTDAKDSLSLKAFIAMTDGSSVDEKAGDINADGVLTARDSLLLRASLADAVSLEDYETDESIYKLTICGSDISEYCIVVPEGVAEDADNVLYAALELQKYVAEAYGVTLSVCYGEGSATAEKMIVFHALLDTGDALEAELGYDGYRYTAADGRMDIYGGLRGNMYAVYDILEKYLGYRFFSGLKTFIYKSRTVDIADGTCEQFIPKLSFRYTDQTFGSETSLDYYYPRKQNGTQLYQDESNYYHGTLYGPRFINAHSFIFYWAMGWGDYTDDEHLDNTRATGEAKVEQWNKEHPVDKQINITSWQPCATSSTSYNQLFTGLLRTIKMIRHWGQRFAKEDVMMSFSINDNFTCCSCRTCFAKSVTQNEGISGLYVDLTNRAARDIKAYYPDMRLFTIIYDHWIPATVRPESNVVIMYCGNNCCQHALGTGGCGDNVNTNRFAPSYLRSNKYDEQALKAWGSFCHESGAEMWFWEYPVTYAYYLVGSPNIFNLYYDYQYLVDECYCTGIYYEGGGQTFNFEPLKAYLSAQLTWRPEMTFEEYVSVMKEYLYMYYGDGYEELYQYILMQDEAGNESGSCFVNNWDRPGEMYSYAYIAEHYEEMRALLTTALDKADTTERQERLKTLILCCDFLGMSASYDTMYTNGTEQSIATYKARYDSMYNRMKALNMTLFCDPMYHVPDAPDYNVNPMIQIYQYGSRRTNDPNVPWGSNNS